MSWLSLNGSQTFVVGFYLLLAKIPFSSCN